MSEFAEDDAPLVASVVIEYLNQALLDLRETGDYLSYATLLDVHLSNPERFSDDDKRDILTALHNIFLENLDIVKEIGWDLPELLLPFFNLEWDYVGRLSTTGLINLNMAIFDTIARNGNAKELFIKSIEILATLPFLTEEELESEEFEKLDRILDLKIHTTIELLTSSLKRINTIYPSKFLAMALSSLLQLFLRYNNFSTYNRLVIRRLYTFARDYLPPLKPLNWIEDNDLTPAEAEKLVDDENYLQRVLLQSFLTNVYALSFGHSSLNFAFLHYRQLQLTKKGLLPMKQEQTEEELTSTKTLFCRFFTLATSYDIDFATEFENLKKESLQLFTKTIESDQTDDEKIQDSFKFSINDKIAHLINPDSRTIPKSPQGLLVMITQYQNETEDEISMTLHELISITIRVLSPGLLSDQFRNFGVLDSILFWSWKTIINATPKDFEPIPKFQTILFLQLILFYSSVIPHPSVGLVSYTLLTKVLTLIDEETSYNFIIDTLSTAPFENAKAAMINILKDLIIRERPSSVSEVTEALKLSSLQDGGKPPVPKRHYIQLNKDRGDDIYALIREAIDDTLTGADGVTDSKVLLGYLNLLIGIRKLYPTDKVKEIVDITKEKLKVLESEHDNSRALIIIALESLETHLLQKD